MTMPEALAERPEPRRANRVTTLALVGGLVALVGGSVAIGGGWLAYSRLSGGGAQPESVLPSDTVAFAKIDLNPSAGQKLAAIRFALRFPDATGKVTESSDLRKVVFDQMQEEGHLEGVDYAADVEPWLGERFAVGLLPGAGEEDPIPVAVLTVTDRDKAAAGLPRIMESGKATCGVREDFAICSEDKTVVGLLTESDQPTTLADSQDFAADMAALGEDGVAAAWVDLEEIGDLADAARAGTGLLGAPLPDAPRGGRVAVALRFAGPHLELAGRATDMPVAWPEGKGGGTGVADLPAGMLGAFGLTGAGEQVKAGWAAAGDLTESWGVAGKELGVSLPEDLYAAIGDRLTFAYAGRGADGDKPRVALVTGGDKAAVGRFVDGLNRHHSQPYLFQSEAEGRPVVATSQDYARELARGSGLGDRDAFRDAVPGAKDARAILYLDVAGLLREHGKDLDAEQRENLAPFAALGVSTRGEGKTAEFTVRLTTR
jgi:hypothetical protein